MTNTHKMFAIIAWLMGVGLTLASTCIFGLSFFVLLCGTTPEEHLTVAEGVPMDVTESVKKTGQYLHFSVAGHRTEYSSHDARYAEISAAAKLGVPVRIWVSTKQETLFPRQGWVPLYKFELDERPILTYAETVERKQKAPWGLLACGSVLLLPGAYLLFVCIRETLWPSTPLDPDIRSARRKR
jgi:hypothetical protein